MKAVTKDHISYNSSYMKCSKQATRERQKADQGLPILEDVGTWKGRWGVESELMSMGFGDSENNLKLW